MFLELRMKNFLSFERLVFQFGKGITLIRGNNHDDGNNEGAGKTAIPNGLCWVLYGKLARDNCSADAVIRNGSKFCTGELDLTGGYRIVRNRKPNDLLIMNPDGSVTRGRDVRHTQEIINELVGMSFETFRQCIYFAQNDTYRFLTSSEQDRVKILSEIRNLSRFDKASKKAHEKAKDFNDTLTDVNCDLDKYVIEKKGLDQKIVEFGVLKQKQVDEAKKKEAYYLDQISRIEKELSQLKIQDHVDKLQQVQSLKISIKEEIEAMNEKYYTIKANRQNYLNYQKQVDEKKKQLVNLEKAIEKVHQDLVFARRADNCPTCGQKTTKTHLEEHIGSLMSHLDNQNALRDEIKAELSVLQQNVLKDADLASVEVLMKERRNSLQDLEKEEMSLATIGPRQDALKRELERLVKESKTLSLETKTIDKSIKQAEEDVRTIDNKITLLHKEAQNLKNSRDLHEDLKNHFKEVKKYAFQSTLDELNRKVNRYLLDLYGVPVKLNMTNVSEDGDISKIDIQVQVNGEQVVLSGGQERRIGLAIDLSLSDIISSRSDKPVNLLIFDEYMTNLSLPSLDKVKKLLTMHKGQVILIEHSDAFKEMIDNQIIVIYENKISRVDEDDTVLVNASGL